jgi:hypothetical protein
LFGATFVALPDAFAVSLAFQFRVTLGAAAVRTNRTIRPPDAFQLRAGFVFGQLRKFGKVHRSHALIVYAVCNTFRRIVKWSAYKMQADFKKATDELLWTFSHSELADALGVSVPTVRQARLDGHAKAHRSPPDGWETKVSSLAKQRGERLLALSKRLQQAKKHRADHG